MTLYIPDCTKLGVQSKDPVPLPLSTKVAPAGSAEVVKDGTLSTSTADTANSKLKPSGVLCAPMAANKGAWLPASITVIVTTSESTASESSVA